MGEGRRLGFPTINLEIPEGFGLSYGVYASLVRIYDRKFLGAMFYGVRKMHAIFSPSLEIHLLINKDEESSVSYLMPNVKVKVHVLKKIREVKDFVSEEELKSAIRDDVEKIRRNLKFKSQNFGSSNPIWSNDWTKLNSKPKMINT